MHTHQMVAKRLGYTIRTLEIAIVHVVPELRMHDPLRVVANNDVKVY